MIRSALFCLLLLPSCIYAQWADTLIHFPSFSIRFNQTYPSVADTFNRIDRSGNRQGKWIEYDSSLSYMIRSSRPAPQDTQTITYWSYRTLWSGYYLDNKKQGMWTNPYGLDGQEINLHYRDGKIQFPIIQPLRDDYLNVITYSRKGKNTDVLNTME